MKIVDESRLSYKCMYEKSAECDHKRCDACQFYCVPKYEVDEALEMGIEALSSSEIPSKWIPISDHNPEKADAYEISGRCFYFGDNTWVRDVGIIAWRELTCRNRIIGGDDLWELR